MKLSIVGTGNLAWHFATAAAEVGHHITHIASRNENTAKAFIKETNIQADGCELDHHFMDDLVILCIPDNFIEDQAQQLQLSSKTLLIHTSGSIPIDVLVTQSNHRVGVIYPLQTFTKYHPPGLRERPLFLEALKQTDLGTIRSFASSLSSKIFDLSSAKRLKLHLAAVFVSNFTNFMYWNASDILRDANLEMNWTRDLAQETLNKAFDIGPEKGQTGPAARNDTQTMRKHIEATKEEDIKEVYRKISDQIIKAKMKKG